MYFVKTDANAIILCERHRIKIPMLSFVRLKEKGYIPTDNLIKSGTISRTAGKYYISVLVDEPEIETYKLNDFGLAIDLALRNLQL